MRARLAALMGVLVVVSASAAAASQAHAADPVMPLSQVRAGMVCEGLSVVRGTAPSAFRVDVIDVLRGEPAVLGPRLLVRVSGPAVDATGIGPGFSGSPVYCRDSSGVRRIAGAISESVLQYGNKVGLATPIEAVLGVRALAPKNARKAGALLRSATPIATPLTLSGLSAPVRQAALTGAQRAGVPLAVAPSSSGPFYPPYELTPGTTVAAGLISGDLTYSALGTVTYRDGSKLWAFGHPLSAAGPRSLPLLDGYVFSVIDNPIGVPGLLSTYKLASAGRPVGALTNDGIGAIAGHVGSPPATIPLTAFTRDLTSGRTRDIDLRVADERQLDLGSRLKLASQLALSEGIVSVLGAAPRRLTTSMCIRIAVAQARKPLGFCERYFDPDEMFTDATEAAGLINGYRYGPLDVRRFSIRTGVRAGVREAFILDARAPRRVTAGERIRLRLRLQRSRAGRFSISFPYRVPRALAPGRRTLTIRGTGSGGFDLEQLFELFLGGGPAAKPARSVEELSARIASLASTDGVRATFSRKGSGRVVYANRRLKIRGKTQIPVTVVRRRGD